MTLVSTALYPWYIGVEGVLGTADWHAPALPHRRLSVWTVDGAPVRTNAMRLWGHRWPIPSLAVFQCRPRRIAGDVFPPPQQYPHLLSAALHTPPRTCCQRAPWTAL